MRICTMLDPSMTGFDKELKTWTSSNLIDRIVVWDRWIEAGLDTEHNVAAAKQLAIDVLLDRIHNLEERVRTLENS
jgi:hypothetical protein